MIEIVNPRTGQRMTFVGESPDCLEIESVNPPTNLPEPEHVHPTQESGCRVTSGVLRFSVSGAERAVRAGESITILISYPTGGATAAATRAAARRTPMRFSGSGRR